MLASLQWIKDLAPDLRGTAASIAKRLTAGGVEVEAMSRLADTLEGVVSAEVKKLSPHPDADKLRVAEVFDGTNTHTVVCGAPNVADGQKVVFAPVGTTLPNGMTLDRRKIRGVESSGMICAEDELGLVDIRSGGILVLKPRTRPGKPIAAIIKEAKDIVYELGVTPNRPDVLSHYGLARELCALSGVPTPKLSVRVREVNVPASASAIVEIKDGKRCPKYMSRILSDVQVGPSPSWVQRRLKAVGIRSISNIVDATNIVLMELGHPLHAFDLEKLEGRKIVVRTAKAKERLKLLDETEIELHEDDLVIADAKNPVALAGVMGGEASEVAEGTSTILLESAMFEPRSVRKSARRHGKHTEASHRFERGADPEMVEVALDRCAQLIMELSANAKVHKGRVGVVKKAWAPTVVSIRPERAALVIGRPVDKKEVRSTLTALGLKATKRPAAKPSKSKKKPSKTTKDTAMYFSVPSWRIDLAREEDLIEEVARVPGFDQIPTLMPPAPSEVWTTAPPKNYERLLREFLAGQGMLEAVSLAFSSVELSESFGLDVKHGVMVKNPLGKESQLMRMSLLPALLRAARLNQDNLPSVTDLRLFEIGRTFAWSKTPQKLPNETNNVALLVRGRRSPKGWNSDGDAVADAFDLKAEVEGLLALFRITPVRLERHEANWLHPRSGTRVEYEGGTLGYFGEAHPALAERFGLEGPPVLLAEFSVDALIAAEGTRAQFAPLPKLPPAQRDLSFFVAKNVSSDRVVGVIRAAGPKTELENVEVFDVYEGKGVPDGQKSLAVSMTFRARDRTLTDTEVEAHQQAIVAALGSELSAQVRTG